MRPYDPGLCILQRKKEYEDGKSLNNSAKIWNKTTRMIGWTPPDSNMVKLNIDDACKDRKVVGCGGVIQHNNGI